MCGIFGLINNAIVSNVSREQMNYGIAAIQRRGPDGQGFVDHVVGNWNFMIAHTRLSIIDLSDTGRQPISCPNSPWILTFNGEIYNYIELRNELRDLGWMFEGNSDSEVLLKAWAHWGEGALSRLNGMFAFAVFNRMSGEMWLIRDRFGVKPLLWGHLPDRGFVFSSSVAAVAKLVSANVDLSYCARGVRYKAFEIPDSEAPFEDVHSIPAGGWVKVQVLNDQLSITNGRWYDLKQSVVDKSVLLESMTDKEVLNECHHLLEDAVQLRLRSDVPLAVSLSGGLDSTAIAVIAGHQVSGLQGFTYGSPSYPKSEGPTVARFSEETGIVANYIWPTYSPSELDGLFERTLMFQEAPFCGLSILAQNEVFRVVRQSGFKVLLGGQGSDEIFAGYRKFFIIALRKALSSRDLVSATQLLYSLAVMLVHEAGQARRYMQNLNRYSSKAVFEFKLLDLEVPSLNLLGDEHLTLTDRQITDVQKWSIPSLLRYEDRNSMGYGIETRLPFMDYRMVELALALPVRLTIARGYGKWALRRITEGSVPDHIRLNRKKRGFDVTQDWIKNGLGTSLRARIHENKDVIAPFMKKTANLDHLLSNEKLSLDSNLLAEAMMLAWLTKPIREPNNK